MKLFYEIEHIVNLSVLNYRFTSDYFLSFALINDFVSFFYQVEFYDLLIKNKKITSFNIRSVLHSTELVELVVPPTLSFVAFRCLMRSYYCYLPSSSHAVEMDSCQTNRTDFELGGIETQFEDMFYH